MTSGKALTNSIHIRAISQKTGKMCFSGYVPVCYRETVLVTAAAGGVGMATVDLAANVLKTKVIGAAGGEEKNKLVLEHGASNVIDYKTQNIREKVRCKQSYSY